MSDSPGTHDVDVGIIGAGPAGAMAAKLLVDQGLSVRVLEREVFPRFSIGESLLPQSMEFLERSGMLRAVVEQGFQYKNGAMFERGSLRKPIDFRHKFEGGWGTTYQVRRAEFDKTLADCAAEAGADIRYNCRVIDVDCQEHGAAITYQDAQDQTQELNCRFLLDASGFGRTLPRLLNLETPSEFPPRQALFAHVRDFISDPEFDRNKILITVHPENHAIWFWLIPFSDGTSSLGVVFDPKFFEGREESLHDRYWRLIRETAMDQLLDRAVNVREVGTIIGYACNVKQLSGPSYALLGNAAEFLDPIFSSGVTIALKSSTLAVPLVVRHLRGEVVDWENEFAIPLKAGVDSFRALVDSWYDGRLQTIIFNQPEEDTLVKRMLVSILAGYAWNRENPVVREPKRRINLIYDLCA